MPPAATTLTPAGIATSYGYGCEALPVLPTPHWPFVFSPQHATLFPAWSTQLCDGLTEIFAAPPKIGGGRSAASPASPASASPASLPAPASGSGTGGPPWTSCGDDVDPPGFPRRP